MFRTCTGMGVMAKKLEPLMWDVSYSVSYAHDHGGSEWGSLKGVRLRTLNAPVCKQVGTVKFMCLTVLPGSWESNCGPEDTVRFFCCVADTR